MPEQQIKIGDIVKLKSGGPKMTVNHVGVSYKLKKPAAECKWFDENKAMTEMFAVESLEIVK